MLTQEQISNYFSIILHFANTGKVKELFCKLGYSIDQPTAELCVQAAEEYGVEFTKPFSKIAAVALESPKYKAYMKMLGQGNTSNFKRLSKANSKEKTPLTNDQKIQLAGNILGSITSWISDGKTIADTVVNADSNKMNAQANLLYSQAYANQQNADSTNKWLIPVIVIVAVLVLAGIIAAVVISNKH